MQNKEDLLFTVPLALLLFLSTIFFYYCTKTLTLGEEHSKALPLESKIPEYLLKQNVSSSVPLRKSTAYLKKQIQL